jgi:hypothetical protein
MQAATDEGRVCSEMVEGLHVNGGMVNHDTADAVVDRCRVVSGYSISDGVRREGWGILTVLVIFLAEQPLGRDYQSQVLLGPSFPMLMAAQKIINTRTPR